MPGAAVALEVRAEQAQLGDPRHELHRERAVLAQCCWMRGRNSLLTKARTVSRARRSSSLYSSSRCRKSTPWKSATKLPPPCRSEARSLLSGPRGVSDAIGCERRSRAGGPLARPGARRRARHGGRDVGLLAAAGGQPARRERRGRVRRLGLGRLHRGRGDRGRARRDRRRAAAHARLRRHRRDGLGGRARVRRAHPHLRESASSEARDCSTRCSPPRRAKRPVALVTDLASGEQCYRLASPPAEPRGGCRDRAAPRAVALHAEERRPRAVSQRLEPAAAHDRRRRRAHRAAARGDGGAGRLRRHDRATRATRSPPRRASRA